MDVSIIETSSLGDRSYLISESGAAVVVDPQRDIDRVLALADDLGVRITHVLETHIHNDYVTGGLELSRTVGAQYVVPGCDALGYPRRAVGDGDIIDAGPIPLQVMHTPGHTHHHVSYVLRDSTGTAVGVFTGGSMLFGTTGRTDLIGQEHTLELTHAQYHSVNRLAAELPDDTEVYPTHGFGSFCAATPSEGHCSTVRQQQHSNPALTQDEQSYVDQLLAGLAAYPPTTHTWASSTDTDRAPWIYPCPNPLTPKNSASESWPVNGWSTCATAPPSPLPTSAAPSASNSQDHSPPIWVGSTSGARP
jgi:hydroxyacylglutathione hydrolase